MLPSNNWLSHTTLFLSYLILVFVKLYFVCIDVAFCDSVHGVKPALPLLTGNLV